eukprot:6473261-Amphidinium_carterae.1
MGNVVGIQIEDVEAQAQWILHPHARDGRGAFASSSRAGKGFGKWISCFRSPALSYLIAAILSPASLKGANKKLKPPKRLRVQIYVQITSRFMSRRRDEGLHGDCLQGRQRCAVRSALSSDFLRVLLGVVGLHSFRLVRPEAFSWSKSWAKQLEESLAVSVSLSLRMGRAAVVAVALGTAGAVPVLEAESVG